MLAVRVLSTEIKIHICPVGVKPHRELIKCSNGVEIKIYICSIGGKLHGAGIYSQVSEAFRVLVLTIEESGELVDVIGSHTGVKTLSNGLDLCRESESRLWVATEPWNATGVDVPPFPECRRKVRRIPKDE